MKIFRARKEKERLKMPIEGALYRLETYIFIGHGMFSSD